MCNNMIFFIILVIILLFQAIFVTFGGRALEVYGYGGLTVEQWFICIGLGALGLIVNFITKFFDEHKVLPGFGNEQRPIG